jgi:protocatechuate 3,4-dioxygenase beta subunit
MKFCFCLFTLWFVCLGTYAQSDPTQSNSQATITGRVVLQNGSPAPGITVVARSTQYVSPTPAGEAVTDANGRYTIPINVNSAPALFSKTAPLDNAFTVSLVNSDTKTFCVPSSHSITVPDAATNVNFILAIGPTITVLVHDAETNKPVPGFTVKWGYYSPASQTAGVTNAQGELTFQVTSQNASYQGNLDAPYQVNSPVSVQLEADPPASAKTALEAAPGSTFSQYLQLLPLQNAVWDIKTYPVGEGSKQVTWYGVVLGPDGKPVPEAQVQIFRGWQNNPKFVTDASGDFWWQTQRIHENEVSPYYNSPIYITATKGKLTTEQPLTPEETWDGIVIHLNATPPAILSGTVVDSAGHPLAGVPVDIDGLPDLSISNLPWSQFTAQTDTLGHFQVPGLTLAGGYTLRLGGWPQGPGKNDFGLVSVPVPGMGVLEIQPSERHDYGTIVVPYADGVVTGQVVDTDGKPVNSNVLVTVKGAHTQVYPDLNKDGTFKAEHLVSEPLTLTVQVANTSKPPLATLPVQVGQQNLKIVVPAGSWEPPPAPAPAPAGPPSVISGGGHSFFYGFTFQYDSQGHVTLLNTQDDIAWQGTLADMNGMSLALNGNQGTLQGADGRALWKGSVWNIPELRIIADRPPESQSLQHVIVRDRQGRTLWSGIISGPYYPVAEFTANTIMLKNGSKVAWTGHYEDGRVLYQFWKNQYMVPLLSQFQNPQPAWDYSLPPFLSVPVPNGITKFSLVSHHAELQDVSGKVLWSGPILVFSLNYPEGIAAPQDVPLATVTNLIHGGKLVIYDQKGQPIPELTTTYEPVPSQ